MHLDVCVIFQQSLNVKSTVAFSCSLYGILNMAGFGTMTSALPKLKHGKIYSCDYPNQVTGLKYAMLNQLEPNLNLIKIFELKPNLSSFCLWID